MPDAPAFRSGLRFVKQNGANFFAILWYITQMNPVVENGIEKLFQSGQNGSVDITHDYKIKK